jgi:predicted anti-sigma-YlaC factor YlaD
MSVLPRFSASCDRAREWASLRLDCELSQLEGALLDAHLDRCGDCRAVAAESSAITNALRSAPLEPLRRPLAIPRRHAALRAARVTAAAAVMLVAAGLGSVFATSVEPHADSVAAKAPRVASDDRLLREMRRDQLKIERAMLQTNSRSQIGHVI